ncbi:uncharacterized protein (DUF849 family) [Albidovulum inexpectatum]|uniref:Uncharacterized protein (DUF849 family) n=1 Tax=Albidovulum inexpectatum TaxID=196587 RepID=A0A2S5JDM1_9RHOB|nr:3-keto-5-aminohexanoate cleavage protein [Albidovulum inexpectatum]PPB79587.1 uncharacterized protein (DUF849 family) [Albidovulum inexpectatum]
MSLPRVMVAPNGARLGPDDHPALPVTVEQIVRTARACQAAGADGLHAHVRDTKGQHVLDAGLYAELLAELNVACPGLYVQVTTESVGRYSPAEQRALVETLRPPAVSIAVAEITADDDDAANARLFGLCHEAGIEVQHILYGPQDIARLALMVGAGIVSAEGLCVLHVLGRYVPGQVSTPDQLLPVLEAQNSAGLAPDWALCAFGPHETECLVAAVASGGKARIGFENNRLMRDGRVARDNAERVAELIAELRAAGLHR